MMYEYRSNKIVVLSKNVRPGYCRLLFKGSNRLVSVKEVCEVMKPELALLATDPKSCKQCDVLNINKVSVSVPHPISQYLIEDIVFGYPIQIPQDIAVSFLGRISSKLWPPFTKTGQWLFNQGCHVIPKANPLDDTGYDCRLSFSVIEVKLARALNDTQKICYRVMKAVVMSEINHDTPDSEKLASYFLKTTLFWFCEETNPDMFVMKNISSIWIALLDRLIHYISEGSIRHYFVPACNLIEHIPASVHQQWLKKLVHIRQEPIQTFKYFWKVFDWYGLVCPGSWSLRYIKTLERFSPNSKELKKPLLEQEMTDAVLFYFLLDSNLPDLYKYVDFCQMISVNGPSSMAQDKGDLWYMLLQKHSKYVNLKKLPEHPDISTFLTEIACMKQQLLAINSERTKLQIVEEEIIEHFFTIAIYNMKEPPLATVVKYANYLRSKERYETLVEIIIMNFRLVKPKEKQVCFFSRYTVDTLDEYIRCVLTDQLEIFFYSDLLLYYFLMLSYQKAGVLAEVFMPGNFVPDFSTWEDFLKFNMLQTTRCSHTYSTAIIWASLLCHAQFYDSAILCCFCDPEPDRMIFQFMSKCIAELYLQLHDEYMAPSGVFVSQRQLRKSWNAAMMDFPRRFKLI